METTAPLPLVRQTVTGSPLVRRTPYNYAPALVHDGGLYHLYWCGGMGGDTILHLQAPALAGPWSAASFWSRVDVALRPTGSAADFDGLHTCDPNVIKLGNVYYLYYTGEAKDGALSEIGVASSRDAIHFARVLAGTPIVVPARTNPRFEADKLTYGAGQPAVVFVPPWIVLSFTDSTGAGGDGQYAVRSKDPTFAGGIEELTRSGWQPRAPGVRTGAFSWLESYGLDLMFDPPSGKLIAATDRLRGRTTILVVDPATMSPRLGGDIPLDWREGPGLLVEAAGKISAPRASCAELDIAVAAAAGASDDPLTWGALDYSAGSFSLAAFCRKP